jgi:hypothetical protein
MSGAALRSGPAAALLLTAAAAAMLLTTPLAAQSVRATGSTSVRYIEVRTIVRDSVAEPTVAGSGLIRQLTDGSIVRCIPEDPFCYTTRPGARVATIPLVHDIDISAWGFGRGVHAHTQLRSRAAWGSGAELWPQADDAFDLLAAYVEVERESYRVRLGRQWKVSGLGFYNFDGVAATIGPWRDASVEAYVGRSLLRGLNEPRAGGALESIEALAPRAGGLLTGVQARYRPSARLAVSTSYQVDFRTDGGGLYSELAAADVAYRIGDGTVETSIEADVASATLNEARLRVRSAPLGRFMVHAETRRYRPYFELWTIWGAFSPVGFDELRGGATWAGPHGRLIVRAEASYRDYEDTGLSAGLDAMRDTGWGVSATASWSPAPAWRIDGSYRVETGVGAARRDGHAGAVRQLGDIGSLAVQALAFQRLYEFRLDEGTVYGLGGEASLRLSDRAELFAAATAYRHVTAGSIRGLDWNQRRGSVRLQWTLGREPRLPLPGMPVMPDGGP